MVIRTARAVVARRSIVTATLLAPLTACGLRLEKDAPLPGPKESAAPDTTGLESIRRHLVEVMEAAVRETHHADAAATAQGLHRDHLKRLDATLEGLGRRSLPAVTATQAPPTSSSTGAGTQNPTASPTPSQTPGKGASSASSPSPVTTAWTSAEAAWATTPLTSTIAQISRTSRPLVLSMASASLANLMTTGTALHWPSEATTPQTTPALVDSLDDAIDALQWWAAKTPADQRHEIGSQLTWAYAARSMAQSTPSGDASPTRSPLRRYASTDEARRVARDALAHTLAACVEAGRGADTAEKVCGVLYVWSGAAGVAHALGSPLRPFPGLAN